MQQNNREQIWPRYPIFSLQKWCHFFFTPSCQSETSWWVTNSSNVQPISPSQFQSEVTLLPTEPPNLSGLIFWNIWWKHSILGTTHFGLNFQKVNVPDVTVSWFYPPGSPLFFPPLRFSCPQEGYQNHNISGAGWRSELQPSAARNSTNEKPEAHEVWAPSLKPTALRALSTDVFLLHALYFPCPTGLHILLEGNFNKVFVIRFYRPLSFKTTSQCQLTGIMVDGLKEKKRGRLGGLVG